MIRWALEGLLARSNRPGYGSTDVGLPEVDLFLTDARDKGIKGILCLLSDSELQWYADVPGGLLRHYDAKGFKVAHVPVMDHQYPAIDAITLKSVWEKYCGLATPVLIHCSFGADRTGAAVAFIKAKLAEEDGASCGAS